MNSTTQKQTIFVPLQTIKQSRDGDRIELIEFLSAQLSLEKECTRYFDDQYKVYLSIRYYHNSLTPKRELADLHSLNTMTSQE